MVFAMTINCKDMSGRLIKYTRRPCSHVRTPRAGNQQTEYSKQQITPPQQQKKRPRQVRRLTLAQKFRKLAIRRIGPVWFSPEVRAEWKKLAIQQPNLEQSHLKTVKNVDKIYEIEGRNSIGHGHYGKVFRAVHRATGREVAVKTIYKDDLCTMTKMAILRGEISILRAIKHHNITRLEGTFETSIQIDLIMELMDGDMVTLIMKQQNGRMNERNTKFIMVQILSAIKYLHEHGIAHCDLKPENVLLSNLQTRFPLAKLCDFGFARFVFGKRLSIYKGGGTLEYRAPEMRSRNGINKSSDMWAVGVILFVALSGTFPINEEPEIEQQIAGLVHRFTTNPWNTISRKAINLIRQLLQIKIAQRLTINQCIAHVWLSADEQLKEDVHEMLCQLHDHPFDCCKQCKCTPTL